MASGRGRTLGAALADLWRQGGRGGGARSTYTATTWKGMFTQLSATQTGYAAMEAAGLSATTRTQRAWLSGDATPTPANQKLIEQAYQAMRGGFNRQYTSGEYRIRGRLTQGRDSRERGRRGNAPLRLDAGLGRWEAIEEIWNRSADPDELEQAFVRFVVNPNLGIGSHPWQFDGDDYEVET